MYSNAGEWYYVYMMMNTESEMNRYMLFCGADTYERSGGMHDFEGFYDTVEAAIARAEAHGFEWYHVVDRENMTIVTEG